MLILGFCVGAYNPQINVFCISRCSKERRGTATAAFNGACDLGLALGSTAAGFMTERIGYPAAYMFSSFTCVTYLRISAYSYPAVAVYDAGAALYRSVGKTSTPMKISVAANGINIVGNVIGVFVFHGDRTGRAG